MNVYVYPDKVWEFANEHEDELENRMIAIADDDITGAVIYVATFSGVKYIVAEVDDEFVESEEFYGEYGGKRVASDFIKQYCDQDDDSDDWENIMVISERETELDEIVFDFMEAITDGTFTSGLETSSMAIQEMKENLIDFLIQFKDVHIYRPMYVEDPDGGEEFYSEFPYDMCDIIDSYY